LSQPVIVHRRSYINCAVFYPLLDYCLLEKICYVSSVFEKKFENFSDPCYTRRTYSLSERAQLALTYKKFSAVGAST
jgi:hypothetical protein